jgi:hypothetical protein
MREMSSGIGNPIPQSSRIPASQAYAPSGVMVERCEMNHCKVDDSRVMRARGPGEM